MQNNALCSKKQETLLTIRIRPCQAVFTYSLSFEYICGLFSMKRYARVLCAFFHQQPSQGLAPKYLYNKPQTPLHLKAPLLQKLFYLQHVLRLNNHEKCLQTLRAFYGLSIHATLLCIS